MKTIKDVHKQIGEPAQPSHIYEPTMKKIYDIETHHHVQKVPTKQEDIEAFYRRSGASIPKLRQKHWKSSHPQRWTGNNLGRDCLAADTLEPTRIRAELGMTLAEFQVGEIMRFHWQVHGSGVAILEQVPPSWFAIACALSFSWNSCLAVLISDFTMEALLIETAATAAIDADRERLRLDRQFVSDSAPISE
jgi:hypothetical protein